jgi:hypothetical protein
MWAKDKIESTVAQSVLASCILCLYVYVCVRVPLLSILVCCLLCADVQCYLCAKHRALALVS